MTETQILDAGAYAARRAEIERLIAAAQGEFESVAFKASTGLATDADVAAAKAHLDAATGAMPELEAAWKGARAAARDRLAKNQRAAFDKMTGEVEGHLAARALAVAQVESAAAAAIEAMKAYQVASRAIRVLAVPHEGGAGGVARVDNLRLGLDTALATATAPTLFAALLSDARVPTATVSGVKQMFDGRTPAAYEEVAAANVRRSIAAFAPREEIA